VTGKEESAIPSVNPIREDDETVSGAGTPGAEIEVTFPDGTKATATVDENGRWTVDVPDGLTLKEGDTVQVIQTESGKDPSDPVNITVTGKEESAIPSVNPIREDDETVSGAGTPGAEIEVTFPDGTKAAATVDENGRWTVDVPNHVDLEDNDVIKVTQTESGKDPSDPVEATVIGNGESQPPTVNPIHENDETISGAGTPGAEIEVTFPNNGPTVTGTVEPNESWEVHIPNHVDLNEGDVIEVTQTEPGRQPSNPATEIIVVGAGGSGSSGSGSGGSGGSGSGSGGSGGSSGGSGGSSSGSGGSGGSGGGGGSFSGGSEMSNDPSVAIGGNNGNGGNGNGGSGNGGSSSGNGSSGNGNGSGSSSNGGSGNGAGSGNSNNGNSSGAGNGGSSIVEDTTEDHENTDGIENTEGNGNGNGGRNGNGGGRLLPPPSEPIDPDTIDPDDPPRFYESIDPSVIPQGWVQVHKVDPDTGDDYWTLEPDMLALGVMVPKTGGLVGFGLYGVYFFLMMALVICFLVLCFYLEKKAYKGKHHKVSRGLTY
jgi:hypothetical protein